ncbi:MAG: transporter, partial [bacterium]
WASIGVKFPLVYADFPSTQTFEVGDIQVNALLALYRPRFEGSLDALAFGLDASLNTGDVETGTGFGQYIVAPYLAASFYPADEIMMTPIIKQFVSLDKDNQGNKRNDLSLRVNTTLTIDQVWVTLVPELLIDIEGDRENLWALRSSLGFMFNPQMGVSGDFVSQLAGEKRFNYLGQLSFRYLLP